MTDAFKQQIQAEARQAVEELLEQAKLKKGDVFVVGCSSSEIVGGHIGKDSSLEAAQAVYAGIAPVLAQRGIWLAAQCCEHLNRAIIMEREAAELLNRLEITIPDLTQPVRVLSGGQRQGIAIARAMLQPVRLLLLDQPTAAMGIRESHQTMQLLRRLRQEDHTLLIVSHDIYQVFDVADRIFVMRAGRCIADIMAKNSSPEELHHLILEREQGLSYQPH